jgi:hypothetical protein
MGAFLWKISSVQVRVRERDFAGERAKAKVATPYFFLLPPFLSRLSLPGYDAQNAVPEEVSGPLRQRDRVNRNLAQWSGALP